MRPLASACVLVLLTMGLHQGDTARKPKMIPTVDELLIQEGDELKLECQGEGRLQFSTQWNMVYAMQSHFYVSVNNDSGSYTFTRPRTTRVDTGWYGCAEDGVVMQNDGQTIVHPDTEISWIYVYVKSSNFLVIDDPYIQDHFIPSVIGRSLVIPCRPTSPDVRLVLLCNLARRLGKGTVWRVVLDLPYDPKIGFIIRDENSVFPFRRCGCAKTIIDPDKDLEMATESDTWSVGPENPCIAYETGKTCGLLGLILSSNDGNSIRFSNPSRFGVDPATLTVFYLFAGMREDLWIEEGVVTQTVRGRNLRLTCHAEVVGAGTTTSLYWKIPKSIPEKRRNSTRTRMKMLYQDSWRRYRKELIIYDVESTDRGEYSCVQEDLINGTLRSATINVSVLEPSVSTGKEVTRVNASDSATLLCRVVGHPLGDFTWGKIGESVTNQVFTDQTKTVRLNEFEGTIYLNLANVSRKDNGTYECRAEDCRIISPLSSLIVTEVPKVEIDTAKAVGPRSVYLRWLVDDGNDPVKMYSIQRQKNQAGQWEDILTNLTRGNSQYDVEGLEKNTPYRFRITATNSIGESEPAYSELITTLDESAVRMGHLALLAGISGACLLCIIVFVVVWMRIRKRREKAARRRFIVATLESQNGVAPDCLDPALNMADQAEAMEYDVKWEFPRKLLKLGKVLGSGAFGTVMKAEASSLLRGEKVSTVAVKMVRATHRLDHMMALQRELKVLAYLGKHVNVVNLLGACTTNISYGVLLVIVEYCRFGNLHDYLRSRRDDFVNETGDSDLGVTEDAVAGTSNDTVILDINSATGDPCPTEDFVISSVPVEEQAANPDLIEPGQRSRYLGDFKDDDVESIGTGDLLNWAWQISRGMKFLGIRRVLHGDLAARNILLADHNVVKICDFGLAKSLVTGAIYKKSGHGPLPIKWMAIESIKDRLFSVNSDVWAFGVVLWELFSLAETPYPGIANDSVYQKLAEGFRMAQPRFATDDLYKTMLRCWDAQPAKRPSFAELEDRLDALLDEGVKTHYLAFDAHYEALNAEATVTGDTNSSTVASSEDNEIGPTSPEAM